MAARLVDLDNVEVTAEGAGDGGSEAEVPFTSLSQVVWLALRRTRAGSSRSSLHVRGLHHAQ